MALVHELFDTPSYVCNSLKFKPLSGRIDGDVVLCLTWSEILFRFSHEDAHLSLVVKKTVFGFSDQVPHKPGFTTTQNG